MSLTKTFPSLPRTTFGAAPASAMHGACASCVARTPTDPCPGLSADEVPAEVTGMRWLFQVWANETRFGGLKAANKKHVFGGVDWLAVFANDAFTEVHVVTLTIEQIKARPEKTRRVEGAFRPMRFLETKKEPVTAEWARRFEPEALPEGKLEAYRQRTVDRLVFGSKLGGYYVPVQGRLPDGVTREHRLLVQWGFDDGAPLRDSGCVYLWARGTGAETEYTIHAEHV